MVRSKGRCAERDKWHPAIALASPYMLDRRSHLGLRNTIPLDEVLSVVQHMQMVPRFRAGNALLEIKRVKGRPAR